MVSAPVLVPSPPRGSWVGWAGVRAALLALTVVVLLATPLLGERAATLDDLRTAVAEGRVAAVEVRGGLPADAVGSALQEVRWREGWQRHHTEVRLVAGPEDGSSSGSSGGDPPPPVVRRDVGSLVRSWDPLVRVDRTGRGSGSHVSGTVLGVDVPGWVGVLVLVQGLGGLLVVAGGPDPARATRWAWFWLSALPLGMTAFLLLSGPLPGRPPVAPGRRRLRGGWAFVLVALAGGAVGGMGAL